MFRDIKRGVSFGITSLQTTSQSRGAPAIKVKLGNELQTFVIYFFNTSVKLPWHWPFLVAMALAIPSCHGTGHHQSTPRRAGGAGETQLSSCDSTF